MKQKWSWLVALGLVLSVFLTACGGGGDDAEQSADDSGEVEQTLNLVNGDTIPTMDPAMATDEFGFQFLGVTMEGLYRLDEQGNTAEGIAMDHEVTEDGLTWTFKLRDDATWSNGDPVTAHDFVYSWRRAVDPQTGSEYGPYMMSGIIKNATAVNKGEVGVEELGVKAEDDYTLVVELEKPVPYFESLTTFGTFMPLNQAFVEEQGDKFATSAEALLSNGPFEFSDWESTSQEWEVVKNEDYWDADTVKLEKMTYVVVKEAQTRVDLYEEGTVDRIELSSDLVDQYATHEDYTVVPDTSVFFLKMNQTRNEALANQNIRAAIGRAFNKQDIADVILNNGSTVAKGMVPADYAPMPDGSGDFREVSGDFMDYNLEVAQELWEKGLAEIGTDTVELELLGGDTDVSKTLHQYLRNQLETNLPGLKVTLKEVPFKQRLDLDTNMEYDLQVSGWGPDYLDPLSFLSLWVTDGENNKMGYSNPQYDALLEQAATEYATDNEARYQNFLEAEQILFEDAAIAPIYQKAYALLVHPKVQGIFNNAFGATYEYKWASVGSVE